MRITNDRVITAGSGQKGNQQRGPTMAQLCLVRWGAGSIHGRAAPAAAAANNICLSQAIAGAADATIAGALASGGVATLDVPRSLQMVSSNAGDTTQTVTARGFDEYGEAMTETKTLNGTTIVQFSKAFKTVNRVSVSAAMTGNLTLGTNTKLGLPFRIGTGDLVTVKQNDTVDVPSAVQIGDTATPTAVTGDIRGTFTPNTAPNGTVIFTALTWIASNDQDAMGGELGQYKA